MKKNCGTCAKQKTCPKAKNIENYRLNGGCADHQWSEKVIACPDCGEEMMLMMDYHYEGKYGQMITGDVYHCEKCLRDDVIERRWECVDSERRQYFHG
jgi:hypothetical protein